MFNQIKYTYITKHKSKNGIMTSLSYALNSFDLMIDRYVIIDNAMIGLKIYPDIIENNVVRCTKDSLESKIHQLIEEDVDLILLNGFEIDFDTIREIYAPIVESSEISLCINELKNVSRNISIDISTAISSLSNEEWEIVKKEMQEDLNKTITKIDLGNETLDFFKKIIPLSEDDEDDENDEDKYGAFKLFSEIFDNIDEDKLKDLDELEPDIFYSQKINGKELRITKTIKGDIIIDNDYDMITIEKDQVEFFINIINLLK